MIVIVLTACPTGLRGHLTRWMLEISPGVFVGHLPARVRDELWERVVELIGKGRALMVHTVDGEQRLSFRVHGHDWIPDDHDGILLMRRPSHGESSGQRDAPENWSIAARRRKYGRASVPRRRSQE